MRDERRQTAIRLAPEYPFSIEEVEAALKSAGDNEEIARLALDASVAGVDAFVPGTTRADRIRFSAEALVRLTRKP